MISHASRHVHSHVKKPGLLRRAGPLRLAIVVLALVALEVACRAGLIKHITMVPPSTMLVAAIDALLDPAMRHSILVTLALHLCVST